MNCRPICITGSGGFIGSALVTRLALEDQSLVLPRRRLDPLLPARVRQFAMPSIDGDTEWGDSLRGCRAVVHLAGLAHGSDRKVDLDHFREVNIEGTKRLAEAALEAGVERFVFMSSIGVNGASTAGRAFDEHSIPAPHAPYAVSKLEAEHALIELVRGTQMELVVIRPPLVYSAYAPGNFAKLLKLVRSGMPMPLRSVDNQRSLIALENLVDLTERCINHPDAAGQLFLASDGMDVSTPEIIRCLAAGMGRSPRLLPCPPGLIRLGCKAINREGVYTQLCDSLTIDSSKARSLLGWSPRIDTWSALEKAGREFATIAH